MAHAQLQLIIVDSEQWKLDPQTIRVGRHGLAQARAALARSIQAEAAVRRAGSVQQADAA
jgi:hypothetical protein